jgi:hypothetical protein
VMNDRLAGLVLAEFPALRNDGRRRSSGSGPPPSPYQGSGTTG